MDNDKSPLGKITNQHCWCFKCSIQSWNVWHGLVVYALQHFNVIDIWAVFKALCRPSFSISRLRWSRHQHVAVGRLHGQVWRKPEPPRWLPARSALWISVNGVSQPIAIVRTASRVPLYLHHVERVQHGRSWFCHCAKRGYSIWLVLAVDLCRIGCFDYLTTVFHCCGDCEAAIALCLSALLSQTTQKAGSGALPSSVRGSM